MRRLILIACAGLVACATDGGWTPAPTRGVEEPAAVIARSTATDWRAIAPENLLLIDMADGGRVVVELAPDFAPVHVANVRAFARGGWWNAATVYRVQDNYVAQWGNGDAENVLPTGVVRTPPATPTAGRSPGIPPVVEPGSLIAMPRSASGATSPRTPEPVASCTR